MVAEKQENKNSQDVGPSKKGDAESRRGNQDKKEKRNLGIILGTLCVLAAVLAVLAIVNGVQKGNTKQGSEVAGEYDSEESEEDKYYDAFFAEYDSIDAEVKRLLAQDPIDVNKIIEIYNKAIDARLEKEEFDFAKDYIRAEYETLSTNGFKKEALKQLLRIDYSVFGEVSQYAYYSRIVRLAKELNDSEVVAKYEPLAAAKKEAADRYDAATTAAREEGEAARQRGIEQQAELEAQTNTNNGGTQSE